jgi:hypothetical protein
MTRLVILCNLDSLEALMHEYAAEELNNDDHLLEQMRFGHFLLWLQRRQEMMIDEHSQRPTNLWPAEATD